MSILNPPLSDRFSCSSYYLLFILFSFFLFFFIIANSRQRFLLALAYAYLGSHSRPLEECFSLHMVDAQNHQRQFVSFLNL